MLHTMEVVAEELHQVIPSSATDSRRQAKAEVIRN
jgi:hypothetical protein